MSTDETAWRDHAEEPGAGSGTPWLDMGPATFDRQAPPQPLTLFAEPDRLGTPDMFADQP